MAALDKTYEDYILLNGGEFCGICGRKPRPGRRLDRDHDHRTGLGRGLLCNRCNRQLVNWVTITWLNAAVVYLNKGQNVSSNEAGKEPA